MVYCNVQCHSVGDAMGRHGHRNDRQPPFESCAENLLWLHDDDLRYLGTSTNQYQKADGRGDQYAGLDALAAAGV